MASDDVRKRLEALNRAPLRNLPPEEKLPARPSRPRQRGTEPAAPLASVTPQRTASAALDADLSLAEALPGCAVEHDSGRRCWHVESDVAVCGEWAVDVIAGARASLSAPRLLTRMRAPETAPFNSATFVDIETLGLTTSEPLFLIGTLRVEREGATLCEQAIARDLDEEAGALEAFAQALAATDLLVSFNGISFDLAMIRGRADAHDVALPAVPPHVDVLLDARYRYGRRLPNCRLMTLEERVCGRTRTDDVPGREVPGVYAEYLRTGNASGVARVARHNVLDLLTTADLFARFYDT
jgi:uncharacterized protein YprB with RNaseH-like and TPR domain